MRSAGILLPVTSLPSPWGVGTMGRTARGFVDFLHRSGQSYWQILPICPTGYGNSPYQSFSSFAGNPYLIDLDTLARSGLLEPGSTRPWTGAPTRKRWTMACSTATGIPCCGSPLSGTSAAARPGWRISAGAGFLAGKTTPCSWR